MAMLFSDPLFLRALKRLSLEAQRYLEETGLDDPSVLESFLWDPETSLDELAHEPEDVPKLEALLVQAKRAARVQRAEFANRGPDGFARADREQKRKREELTPTAPSELQRAVEAPPQWHCRRLPSRLARCSRLEGDSKAEEAEEEERLRWAGEVADLILTLRTTTAEAPLTHENAQQSAGSDSAKLRPCLAPILALVDQFWQRPTTRKLRTSTGVLKSKERLNRVHLRYCEGREQHWLSTRKRQADQSQ